ncbi:MAG: hypothetical protein M3R51_03745 [Candidatus Eremiobacteraeota bacterium]|nr:hypothetical protein [Candidatus Eremiobacteraeota bacterium]
MDLVQKGLLGHTPPHPPVPVGPITAADRGAARSGGWQPVAATAPFGSNGAGTPLLMTDGTVMIGDNTSNWYSLTPDSNGSYIHGSWKKRATLPGNYGPLYFASAVLPDGKLVINGGEYNFFQEDETNLGAIYDPVANTWTSVNAPNGWSQIGDAQSAVLANGTYMLGNCCTSQQALFNESSKTFTTTGTGKADANSEEGWTLLPNGKVLTADVGAEPHSELYSAASGSWSSAGSLPANLTNAYEIGPQTLRPNGTVFVAGADKNTAIYSTATRTWSAGPALPTVSGAQLDSADGPTSVLTSGNVLIALSPGVYQSPTYFYIFNGSTFTHIAGIPNAKNDSSYNLRLMMLPTGQVLATDGSNDVEIYTSTQNPDGSFAPSIASVPTTLAPGNTYTISGVHLNGFTQANAYGDDAQMATNYPLVEIVNAATHHVFFARTHNHSSMAVESPATVSTKFDVPANVEPGSANIYVVANGIKSSPVTVTVQ